MPSAPSSTFQLLALLLFVLPGIVHAGTLEHLRGPAPAQRDVTVRVLGALTVSTVLCLVWLPLVGSHLALLRRNWHSDNPSTAFLLSVSGCGLLIFYVVPAALAFLRHAAASAPAPYRQQRELGDGRWRSIAVGLRAAATLRYDPTPSAWDFIFRRADPCFLKILLSDGRIVAGLYGSNSFAAGFPDPHELFLEQAYEVDADGNLVRPLDTQLWVSGSEIITMEFIEAVPEGGRSEERPHQ